MDRETRFPTEAVAALRTAGLLGAAVPRVFGGKGARFSSIAAICYELGQGCANTAMVFAMHQIQVACLVRHASTSAWHRDFLSRLARDQLLVASATTEAGTGGDVRRSACAVVQDALGASLEKAGCVISYAEQADAILATARRNSDSAASDQAAILAEQGQYRLDPISRWDALGMRGTCSRGYNLTLEVAPEQVVPGAYDVIAAETMLPVSHITWAALWLGIATGACTRARAVVRRRTQPGGPVPAGAVRLANALTQVQALRAQVSDAVRRFEAIEQGGDALSAIPFILSMNQLKLSASTGTIQIVGEAMLVAGLAGYRNDSPESLGRHLRDAHSSTLMINNERIISNCTALLGGYRGEEGLYS